MKLNKNTALLLSAIVLALLLLSFIAIAFPKPFTSILRPLLYICIILSFAISAYLTHSLYFLFQKKERMSENYSQILDEQTKSLSQLSEHIKLIETRANFQMPSLDKLLNLKNQKRSEAQNNIEIVNNVCQNSNEVETELNTINNLILEIKSNSQNIKGVIRVIDDIAFQTNILALNAAVEAARAGESGQGFAVVADQVKELAQKAASAASKTGDLINEAIINIHKGEQVSHKILEKQKQKTDESRKAKITINEFHTSLTGFLTEIENFQDEYDVEKNAVNSFVKKLNELKSILESLEKQQEKMKKVFVDKVILKPLKKPASTLKKQKKANKSKKPTSIKKTSSKINPPAPSRKVINTAQPKEEIKSHKISFENRKKTNQAQKDSPEITKPEEVLPLDDFDGF